jgi:CRP/FNR family transcriptional regulator, anaerobic regulatory protein
MIPLKLQSAWQGIADCQNCGIRDMVLFAQLTEDDFNSIHAPIDDLNHVAGHTIFMQGDTAEYLYTVRSGRLKLIKLTADGSSRVVGVLNQGDVLGLETLVSDVYDCEAVSVDSGSLCRIPKRVIQLMAQRRPALYTAMMQRWHRAHAETIEILSAMNHGTAHQRVVNMIMSMRQRQDPQVCSLLSRHDMGSLAGLTLETVSRVVAALVREEILIPLDKVGRLYKIADLRRLQSVE